MRVRRAWCRCELIAPVIGLLVSTSAVAQLSPERAYYGVNRAAPMMLKLPDATSDTAAAPIEPVIELYEPRNPKPIASAPAAAGRVDLAALFPILWTGDAPRVLYAQLRAGDELIGPPVVLQPMLSPRRSQNQLMAAVWSVFERGNAGDFGALFRLSERERTRMRRAVELESGPTPLSAPVRVFTGVRAWVDRHVVLDTSAGVIEFALRPDAAPNTCWHFLSLVDGGFYTDIAFHRVLSSSAGAGGKPLLAQAGDPLGTGVGGPGFMIDFEASTLAHDFGVVSLARQPDDPNTGGSQFIISLSRDAGPLLDGQYTSFAQVVTGIEALQTIAASPVGPLDVKDPTSAREKPLQPIVIKSAKSIAAPPFGTGPKPITPADAKPVER